MLRLFFIMYLQFRRRSLVLFTFADIIIHSYYPQQLFNGLEIAFSIQIPDFLTPVSSPAVVPMATMLDIFEAISANILGLIEKNATEAKICNSTSVVLPSPSPTIYYNFTEEQLRENYVMVTLGLTTLQQVIYFLNIYTYKNNKKHFQ